MDDKISKLKSLAELRDSGILSEAEFGAEKAKIMAGSASPQQPYGAPQQPYGAPGMGGSIPTYRRSGWLWWLSYIGIIFFGSVLSFMFYADAIGGGECYTEYSYYGDYEWCDNDPDLMFMGDMISLLSSIGGVVIYLYWCYSMYNEHNNFVGYEVQNPFLAICIPVFNIYAFYTFCDDLNKQAAARGRTGFIDPTLTCCLTLILGIGLPMYQSKLNEFWDIIAYERMNG